MARLVGSKRTRTTAYHPEANGMVERWHRSLKTAIKCHETDDWVSILPIVLLGLRTSVKEDIKASAAELVYGTTLKIPGEYFTQEESTADPQYFKEQLREHMKTVRATLSAHHTKMKTFTHKDLYTFKTHVFVRVDAVRRPLEQPYQGPFEVIKRPSDRVFSVNFKGIPTTISVERLKPAFREATIEWQQQQQSTTTAEGESSLISDPSQ